MNQIIFRGNVVKVTPAERGNKEFCYIKIARNNGKNKEGADLPATFIDFEAWDNTAKYIKQYCSVGQLVLVDGHLSSNIYEKDGQKIYKEAKVIDHIYSESKKNTSTPTPEKETVVANEAIDVSDDDLPF